MFFLKFVLSPSKTLLIGLVYVILPNDFETFDAYLAAIQDALASEEGSNYDLLLLWDYNLPNYNWISSEKFSTAIGKSYSYYPFMIILGLLVRVWLKNNRTMPQTIWGISQYWLMMWNSSDKFKSVYGLRFLNSATFSRI